MPDRPRELELEDLFEASPPRAGAESTGQAHVPDLTGTLTPGTSVATAPASSVKRRSHHDSVARHRRRRRRKRLTVAIACAATLVLLGLGLIVANRESDPPTFTTGSTTVPTLRRTASTETTTEVPGTTAVIAPVAPPRTTRTTKPPKTPTTTSPKTPTTTRAPVP